MSRQIDLKRELRETARRDALVKALDFELAGTLDTQGITLLGFAVKYDAWECLLTLKADIGGERNVSFVGSDTVMNCILKSVIYARQDRLRWKLDAYTPSVT